ncbi:M24 family metallopeptidase [Mesorhizobium sp. M0601]|uniref:M24 family metallopeptidase n=1 Tax=Mesorhizobium sp. M0601 TaxID=2956969 RepID=UPI003337140C
MKVADATRLVGSVQAVKSQLELTAMREAMSWTDLAIQTFQRSLRDGITEAETAAAIEAEVAKVGGRVSFAVLGFGDRTRLPHVLPDHHPIRNNEPAIIELGGVKHGYEVGVCRSAVLGQHPEAEALHALSVEALEAVIDAMRPGATAGEVDAAACKVLDRSGRPRIRRQRAGYSTGIKWSARGNPSLEPGATDVLEVGMTFHMPTHLFGGSGYIIGCSEHVLVTDGGAEILSRTPHILHHA